KNFKTFLSEYLPAQPGEMQSMNGDVQGNHDGLMYYTIGQRHGLGIGGEGEPWFVVGKNLDNNVLYVEQGDQNEYLYSDRLIARNVNWLKDMPETFTCTAKFRYRHKDTPVTVTKLDEQSVQVDFFHNERAVTPGQSVVLYQGDICLGGGTIEEIIKEYKKSNNVGKRRQSAWSHYRKHSPNCKKMM